MSNPIRGLRSAIIWVCIGIAYVVALSFYKSALMDSLAQQGAQSLSTSRHAKFSNLFQASFYFFYEDQFVPGVSQLLAEDSVPRLERVSVLAPGGALLYDSGQPGGKTAAGEMAEREVIAQLGSRQPTIFVNGFRILILQPGEQFSVLYSFDASVVRSRVAAALILGVLLASLARWLLGRRLAARLAGSLRGGWSKFWRLRVKFLAAIVLVNLITAAILFVTLTQLQTREQTERIERDSVLFSQFSTAQVISNFTNFYYFYYSDRFLPETKRIIASNENLVALRILSRRTGAVLFDSESPDTGVAAGGGPGSEPAVPGKAEFSPAVEEQLKSRDLAVQLVERAGGRMLSVVNTYRNENQEAVFWVEYLFSFETLARSIQAIRRQILVDLVPSLALGLLIAVMFAQLLISPIRRLVAALGKVSQGDYEAHVELARPRTDEVGELVMAFNAMTEELRKKKELRKYLSDSTYRTVMKAPDVSRGGSKLGGSRVSATVLFSDIRDFVTHCENLEAEEVTAMLNEYFTEMVDVIHKHGGEVDKFIGDALLAVFYATDEARTITPSHVSGAPAAMSSSATALQALYCALEMRERLVELNQRRRVAGRAIIETGVGITHGEIISGPIGSKDRMDFTVIGDVVNLASRIEKLSKRGKHTRVVFSDAVEERVRGLLDYELMEEAVVRGKEAVVRTFELIGVKDLERLVRNLSSAGGADDGSAVGDALALRRRSVELLGHSRNPIALPHVLRCLSDSDEGTRLQAVLSVGKLAQARAGQDVDVAGVVGAASAKNPGAEAFAALVARLRVERSDKVVSALIAAIGKLAGARQGEKAGDRGTSGGPLVDQLIEALSPYLASPNERILANAIEALGHAREPRCTDLILPSLASRNNRVKANAAMAMFAAGHIEVIDTLKPMLMHSDPLMRSSAAFAIGELTVIAEQDRVVSHWKTRAPALKLFLAELQECVPMLVACLRDSEPAVRRQAVIALGKIKDKSAVLPMIDLLDPSAAGTRELVQDISEALRSIGSHKLVREVIAKLSSPS